MKPFSPLGALRTLIAHKVSFVIIGGLAARLHGSPTMTDDLDICHDKEPVNLERLAAALREMNARLRGAPDDVTFLLDAKTLARGDNFTFTTDQGPLDCLARPAGTEGFATLVRHAVGMELGDGLIAKVCSLHDLITMKEASGRAKDRVELEILAALQEEIEGAGDS